MSERSTQLSHSAVSKYQLCPRSYRYHYVDRLRERTTSGALLFGSAMDSGINSLLASKKGEDYKAVFEKAWNFNRIGKREEYLPDNEKIVYAASDFDRDLLDSDDKIKLLEKAKENGYGVDIFGTYADIAEKKKQVGWKNLTPGARQFFNFANWLSMRRKGYLMLSAYIEKVLPKIRRVLASQKKIQITNAEGDTIIGYVDLVVEWEDGRIIIFDNKTSSMEYAEDAVLVSPQLALYMYALEEEFGTRNAGFIVMRKSILKNKKKLCLVCGYQAERGARHKTCSNEPGGKRCGAEWQEEIDPEVDMQILIQEIPPRTEEIVLENYNDINQLIKQEIFPRNFNSCHAFGSTCAFYKLCFQNDDSELEKA